MEREEIIEKIVKIILDEHLQCVLNRKEEDWEHCTKCEYKDGNWCLLEKKIASAIYDCLIPDGAVVLTREDYEDMQERMAYYQEELGKLLRGDNISVSAREYGQLLYLNENARKETAREIFEKIHEKEGYYPLPSVGTGQNDMIEIAKVFGIKYTPDGVEVE